MTRARPQCTSHAKSTGERCRAQAVPGALVCDKHGGGAPQVRQAADRRVLLQERGFPVGVDAHEALQVAVDEANAVVLMHLEEVMAWRDRGVVSEEPPAWLDGLRAACTDLARVTSLAAGAKLDERRVRLDEVRAELVTRGLEAYRLGAGVEDDAHIRGLEAMASALGFQGQIAA